MPEKSRLGQAEAARSERAAGTRVLERPLLLPRCASAGSWSRGWPHILSPGAPVWDMGTPCSIFVTNACSSFINKQQLVACFLVVVFQNSRKSMEILFIILSWSHCFSKKKKKTDTPWIQSGILFSEYTNIKLTLMWFFACLRHMLFGLFLLWICKAVSDNVWMKPQWNCHNVLPVMLANA